MTRNIGWDIADINRLSYIGRWQILGNSIRRQSVAEHSYNVAMLIVYLFNMKDRDPPSDLLVAALMHDYDEIYTGDLPAGFKNTKMYRNADILENVPGFPPSRQYKLDGINPFYSITIEGKTVNWSYQDLIKLMDMLEAKIYLNSHTDSSAMFNICEKITQSLERKIGNLAHKMEIPSEISIMHARMLNGPEDLINDVESKCGITLK